MIHQQRLIDTFTRLASIDSISRGEAQLSREIQQMISPMAHEIIRDRADLKINGNTGNLIVKVKGDERVDPLLINAHMDTVEPGRGVKPKFSDGVFTSDGTTVLGADDKSAIAIIIETLQILHENHLPHGPLEIVFTVAEEIGLLGAKSLDFDLISAKYGFALDTADTESIIVQAPTAARFEIRVHGRDAHAGADPEKGINAIWLAGRAISGLRLGRVDDETTSNIGVIEARGATNIVPNLASIQGEARSHDERKLEQVVSGIISAFEDVAAEYRRANGSGDLPRVEADIEQEFPRTFIPESHPVVRLVRRAAKNLGRTITPRKTGGGSDANIFFGRGIVTGVIGTGMQEIHTVRESIRLADMEKSVRLLLEIISLHHEDGGI